MTETTFNAHTRTPSETYPDSFLPRIWQITHAGTPKGPLRPDEQVGNTEGLCRGVLKELTRGLSEPVEDADWVDSLGFLLGETVVLAAKYPRGRPGFVFRAWLYQRLCWALIDHWRRTWGRHGEKRVADLRKLEDVYRQAGVDDGDRPAARLEQAAGGDGLDSQDALRWLFADGDREDVEPDGGSRRDATTAAEGCDGGAGVGAVGRAVGAVAGSSRGASPWRDCVTCGWRHYPHAPNGVDRWTFPDFCTNCDVLLVEVAA